jgi:hypothetical protein
MSERNKAIIEKALVATTTGGQLSPEQASSFIDTVIKQSTLLSEVTVIPMNASEYQMDIIGIAGRQMRAAVEGTDPGFTGTVTIPRRTLNTTEVILPYDISINFLEENISQAQAESQLNTAFATQFGNDLNDLAVIGDEDSVDLFIKINDGWIDIAVADGSANVVDLASGTDYKVLLGLMLAGLPVKYRRNRDLLKFFVSPDFEEGYRVQLQERATGLGDTYLAENKTAFYHGIEVVPNAYWTTRAPILTTKSNLHVGIGRNITVEREKKPRKRIYEYTITAKIDFNYAVSELMVVGQDLT